MISYEDSLEMHEAVIGYISRWLNQNPSSTLARLAIEARVQKMNFMTTMNTGHGSHIAR